MKTFDIQLETGFEYHFKNSIETAKFITISAHSMRHMDKVAPIKEITVQAVKKHFTVDSLEFKNLQEENDNLETAPVDAAEVDKEEDEVINGKQIMSIIYGSCKPGDVAKLWAYMKKLLTAGLCSIDGEVAFGGDNIDKLTPSDFENLCGAYIGNFIAS